jgi:hypothetical protein
MKTQSDAREAHELLVFAEFAQAAALPAEARYAFSRMPPEPDLVTTLDGRACYFELGRLADTGFAKFMLEVRRRSPTPVAPNYNEIGYPQRDMLRQKLSKSYQNFGHPIHLVLYFDIDAHHVEGPLPPMPFEQEATHVMEPILRQSMGPFSKVWYFERYRRTVLWSYP